MKKIVSTDKAPAAIGPYNQAIIANGFVFVSGQIPLNPASMEIVKGGIAEQTKQVLINLKAVLEEAGVELGNVVKTSCFLSDMNNFQAMNEVYAQFFTEEQPARAAVEVSRLPKDVLIEIEAVAVI